MAGNENSGRKKKTLLNEEAKHKLSEGLAGAVKYIVAVAKGKEKADFARQQDCEYLINQCIGKPTQRVESEQGASPELLKLLEELSGIHKGDMPIKVEPSEEEKQLEAWERKERGDFESNGYGSVTADSSP